MILTKLDISSNVVFPLGKHSFFLFEILGNACAHPHHHGPLGPDPDDQVVFRLHLHPTLPNHFHEPLALQLCM